MKSEKIIISDKWNGKKQRIETKKALNEIKKEKPRVTKQNMSNEMKLIVPQFITLTASYSHKLVPENYGIEGHRFAPIDFFQSYNSQVPLEEATPEKLKAESNRLYEMAKSDVEGRIKETLEALRNPQDATVLTAKDLDGIAPFVKMLISGSSETEYTAAITVSKEKLNENQLNFLRNLLRTIRT